MHNGFVNTKRGSIVALQTVLLYGGPHDGFVISVDGKLPPYVEMETEVVDVDIRERHRESTATYRPNQTGDTTYYYERLYEHHTASERATEAS